MPGQLSNASGISAIPLGSSGCSYFSSAAPSRHRTSVPRYWWCHHVFHPVCTIDPRLPDSRLAVSAERTLASACPVAGSYFRCSREISSRWHPEQRALGVSAHMHDMRTVTELTSSAVTHRPISMSDFVLHELSAVDFGFCGDAHPHLLPIYAPSTHCSGGTGCNPHRPGPVRR